MALQQVGREDTQERRDLVNEVKTWRDKVANAEVALRDVRAAPADEYEAIAALTHAAKRASDRWTNNIFALTQHVSRAYGMDRREFRTAMGIPDDLDEVAPEQVAGIPEQPLSTLHAYLARHPELAEDALVKSPAGARRRPGTATAAAAAATTTGGSRLGGRTMAAAGGRAAATSPTAAAAAAAIPAVPAVRQPNGAKNPVAKATKATTRVSATKSASNGTKAAGAKAGKATQARGKGKAAAKATKAVTKPKATRGKKIQDESESESESDSDVTTESENEDSGTLDQSDDSASDVQVDFDAIPTRSGRRRNIRRTQSAHVAEIDLEEPEDASNASQGPQPSGGRVSSTGPQDDVTQEELDIIAQLEGAS